MAILSLSCRSLRPAERGHEGRAAAREVLASGCPYPAPSFQVLSRLRCQGRLVPSTGTPPSAFRNGAKSLYIYSCVVAPEMPIIQHLRFTSSFSLAARTWFQQRPRDHFFLAECILQNKNPCLGSSGGVFCLPFPHNGYTRCSAGETPKTIHLSFPPCFLSAIATPLLLLAGGKQDFVLLALYGYCSERSGLWKDHCCCARLARTS